MSRNRTSYTPETAPKGKGGSTHLKTRLKEQIGLNDWETLSNYVENEGAARFLNEMQQLQGRDFVLCYLKLLEYFKPRPKAAEPPAQTPSAEMRPVIVQIQRRPKPNKEKTV